ncbi:MAG: hypothetical protein CL878_08815 [Dehalococcoidia bacterium]|nr:hypothetical protein [Dehalococcoidia bacterium]
MTTTPDARIRASFAYWVETKITPQSVSARQISGHLKALDAAVGVERQRLLVLTPDAEVPPAIRGIGDERLAWASFDGLLDAIRGIIDPETDGVASDRVTPTEYERGLLRELARFILAENLVGGEAQRVLVVAAGGAAFDDYLRYSAYMCQPNRSFQPSAHLGLYRRGRIDRRIPLILGVVASVVLSEEAVREAPDVDDDVREQLLTLVGELKQHEDWRVGEEQKVLLLSAPDAPETIVLPQDVVNDLVSEAGRSQAFTQGHRYVSLERIEEEPARTSELVG